MADDREQRKKVIELMREGSTRRIRLTVLALSGIVLQALVYWYAAEVSGKEWVGIQVWAFVVVAWILTVGMALALLRKRLKDMREAANHEG